MSVFVGIDGGGTRTRALVVNAAGEVVGRAEGGAGRVDVTKPAAGAADLAALVRTALRDARVVEPAAVLCCALAGAGRPAERSTVEQAVAATGVARKVIVVGDFEAALQNAFDTGPGILVISGTGSSAWGRGESEVMGRCGGWGHILGDEGSGYAIGQAGLRAALQAYDGRLGRTSILSAIMSATRVREPESLIRWAAEATKAEIAGVAPSVIDLAAADPTAAGILEGAARDLALHVGALHARLAPWSSPAPVAFAGGLIGPGRPFRPYVTSALEAWDLGVTVLDREVDAAAGAAALARLAVAS